MKRYITQQSEAEAHRDYLAWCLKYKSRMTKRTPIRVASINAGFQVVDEAKFIERARVG